MMKLIVLLMSLSIPAFADECVSDLVGMMDCGGGQIWQLIDKDGKAVVTGLTFRDCLKAADKPIMTGNSTNGQFTCRK